MDPEPFTPPEVILNYEEEPVHTQSGSLPFYHFPPHYKQPFSAELNTQSREITSCEARMDGSASQRAATVAEILRSIAHSDHRTSWTQTASNPTLMGPIEHQGSPSFLHFLPGVSPSPLSLQDFSPDATWMGLSPLFPEIVLTPTPQDTCCLNMSPLSVSPDSRFGFSPFVLVPGSPQTESWFSPYSPAHSWLTQPEFHPSWCMCPESVQHCSPGLLSRAESAASAREQSEEQSESNGQRSKICREEEREYKEETPVKEKLHADDSGNNTTKSETSPTFLDPLDDELLAKRAFEDYMLIMDDLSPKVQENVDTKVHENEEERDGEEEELETDYASFLAYLDELCMDEAFVRKVGLTLNTEYLDSLLSSSLLPIDLLALEEQEQVTLQEQPRQPAAISSSDPVTDGTSPVASTLNIEEYIDSFLSSDPEPIDFIPLKEQEQETLEEGLQEQSLQPALCCSPFLPSHLLEETPESQANGSFPLPEGHCSPLYHNGSLFMDYSFTSSLQALANASPDTSLTSDLTEEDGDALVAVPAATLPAADSCQDESEDASVSLKNLTDNQSAQSSQKLQDGALPGDHLASKSPSGCRVSSSLEDPSAIAVDDPAPSFRADLLTYSLPQSAGPPALRVLALKTLCPLPPPPAQIREDEEHHSPVNPKSCPTPPKESDDTNYAIPVPASLSLEADSCDAQADGDISGLVPERRTAEPPERLQVPQESATPGISSELWTGERRETETKCERDPEKGVRTLVTEKQKKEKGLIKKTFEKKENKETKLKGTANAIQIRRSGRQSGRRLFGEYKTETAEERKPSEKSIKKMTKLTAEKDGVIYEKQRRSSGEKQLCKREESQGTKVINAEQSGETADKKQDQKLTGEQSVANSSNVCMEMGVHNTLLTKTQDKIGEKRVNREEEGAQMSSIVRRRTRSTTTEEKVQPSPVLSPSTRARQKIKHSEMQRSEMKSLTVSSPKKRSRNRRDEEGTSKRANETDSSGCEAAQEAPSSLPSPRVQADTHSTRDSKDDQGSLEESPGETVLNERNEPLPVKTWEQQMKTVNDSDVTGNESYDFYSLKSTTRNTSQVRTLDKPNLLNRRRTQDNKVTQATHHLFGLRNTSPDETADAKGETEKTNEEEHPSLTLSPVKRHRQECGDKVELESEMHKLSPIKRTRRKNKTEVKFERAEKQMGNKMCGDGAENQDDAETSGCISSSASVRGKINAVFAGQETSEAKKDAGRRPSRDECSVAETTTNRFSCKRQTRLSAKLPTKYRDFVLYKPKRTQKTPAGQAEKKDRKRKKK